MEAILSRQTGSDLNNRLERLIEQKTGGRVHGVRVESDGRRVIVHGHTGSYGVRQLALHAALEALESLPSEEAEHVSRCNALTL